MEFSTFLIGVVMIRNGIFLNKIRSFHVIGHPARFPADGEGDSCRQQRRRQDVSHRLLSEEHIRKSDCVDGCSHIFVSGGAETRRDDCCPSDMGHGGSGTIQQHFTALLPGLEHRARLLRPER
jgi:hypothetical protein